MNENDLYDIGGCIGKNSGGDFTVAYLSATTLTLGTLPDGSSVTADDIVALAVFTSTGKPKMTFERDQHTMAMATNVLTVTGASFSAGDIFVLYTNVPRNGSAAAAADAASNATPAPTVISRLFGYNGSTWDRLRTAIVSATSTLTGILNTLPLLRYNATPPTLTDGQVAAFQADANGFIKATLASLISGEDQANAVLGMVRKPLAVSTYTFSKDVSSALEASTISKATAGNLYRAFGVIDKSAASGKYYIQFLDSATLPAEGSVTHIISPLVVNHTTGTDTAFDTGMIEAGVAATSGIVMVFGSTLVTKTIGGSYMFGTVLYK